MADDQTDPASRPPDYRVVVEQSLAGLADADKFLKTSSWLGSLAMDVLGQVIQWLAGTLAWVAAQLIRGIAKGFDAVDPAFGEVAKAGLQALFGIDVPASSFTRLTDPGSREELKRGVGKSMINVVTGTSPDAAPQPLAPSLAPAERYLGTIANFAIEGWMMEMLGELESLGYLEHFGELKDVIAEMFGFGRLTRRVLSPLIDATIVTPTKWAVNKAYLHTELSNAQAVRAFLGGFIDDAALREVFARAGYPDKLFYALVAESSHHQGADDLDLLVRVKKVLPGVAKQHLREQGYEGDVADRELLLPQIRRTASFERSMAAAAIDAFVDGRIDGGTLDAFIHGTTIDTQESAQLRELALARRALRIRPLTSSEARRAVADKVLAVIDYREALRREGRDELAVLVLELGLRAELDKEKTIEQHRADAAAERALEQAKRDAEQKTKRAQVEADRVKKRRGSVSDLERAAVVGLIPIARYEEVIASDYDADTVDIMVGLVEDERQKYVTQQQRAADAAQRVNRRGLDVGQLQQAVLSNLLTIPEFSARLTQLGFDPPDVLILAETLAVRKHDQDMARQKRDDAAAAAARRSIDLPKLETLVRKGIRPIDAYAAQLEALGYDEADRADLVALLEQRIAEDRAAEAARKNADASAGAGALTIDQFRRSVLLGLQSMSAFDLFLTNTGVSADVHALLVAELEDDLAQAEAARRRRDAAAATNGPRELPLDVVARAARLGIVSVSVYQDRLARAGYSPDDVALETELLTTEIADVQAARQQRDALPFTIGEKGLTLAQLAVAVKAGVRPLEDYRAAAITAGLKPDAVETLVRVLGDELRETQAAKVRREQLGSELDARGTSLAVLGDQVRSGALTLDAYFEQLVALGIAPEDADVLWTLLSDELVGGPVPA